MQEEKNIASLLFRYLQCETTAQEEELIRQWASQHPSHQHVLEQLQDEVTLKADLGALFDLVDAAAGKERLDRMLVNIKEQTTKRNKNMRLRNWIPYAAACLLIFAGITFFMLRLQEEPTILMTAAHIAPEMIQPGKNRAVLTVEGNNPVELRQDDAGLIVVDGAIVYGDGTKIISENPAKKTVLLQTPRGGQYTVRLSDGTKVYLNAESSLRYPNYFDSSIRGVELEGEAYFEVAKGTTPFIVKSDRQEIEVLGTSFNISAYADDTQLQTTLVEGLVNIKTEGKDRLLRPGQQFTFTNGGGRIIEVDTYLYTAWKDGAFSFSDETLESILKRASRWYDVQVAYSEEGLKMKRFEGYVSRFSSMEALLKTLEMTGEVSFEISGRTVQVRPKK